MKLSKLTAALAAAVAAASMLGLAFAAAAPDAAQIVKERQALMKRQGKDIGGIKAYLTGKADVASAQQSAADLARTTRKIPSLFPPGTGMASPDGKFQPKPEVWKDWDKFLAAQKNAVSKAEALDAAAKTGDKAKIGGAFADLGKNGCGGCHSHFREKLKD